MANTRKPTVFAKKQEDVFSINGKQIYIYRVVLDPTLYPPHAGDPISGKFETPTEIDTKPLSKSISEALNSSQDIIEKNAKKGYKTTKNPGFLADKVSDAGLSLLTEFMKHQPPHGTGGLASKNYTLMRNQYKSIILDPRLGSTYPLQEDIGQFRFHNESAGSIVEQKIASNILPSRMAETWIVSDTSPDEIRLKGKMEKSGNEFVCFSKEDAKKVVQAINQNRIDNIQVLKESTVIPHQNLTNIDEEVYKNIVNEYLDVLHKWDKKLYSVINRQYEYERDMKKIASEFSANQGGERTTIQKAHTSFEDRGNSYDIGLKDGEIRRAGKIYFECTDAGISYEVIGKDNKLKQGVISWHVIPWFPRDEKLIMEHKEHLLPVMLTEMNKAHPDKEHGVALIRYPHFEQMEHINWEIKYLIDYIQNHKGGGAEFTPEVRQKIHKDMQNIVTMLTDYIRLHPYESTDSVAHEAFWRISTEMSLANDEIKNALRGVAQSADTSYPVRENLHYSIPLSDDPLVWEVDKKIQDIKDKRYQDSKENKAEKASVYKDKITVLKAAKDCLNGKININQFESILDNHPEYDKGFSFSFSLRSETGELVDNVLKNIAVKVFTENKINEMKSTDTYKRYSVTDQARAIEILKEDMEKIDYSKLDIDLMRGNNGKMNVRKSSVEIYNQFDDLRNMEKYTQSLISALHPAAYYKKVLENYIATAEGKFFNPRMNEKIEAARAYKNYLTTPTQENLDALRAHEKAKEGKLGEIIEQIEKAKITIIPSQLVPKQPKAAQEKKEPESKVNIRPPHK